jgi:hypothetical protein
MKNTPTCGRLQHRQGWPSFDLAHHLPDASIYKILCQFGHLPVESTPETKPLTTIYRLTLMKGS